jgi:hypothetical protein
MRSAAVELAAGILLGLYNCRHGNSETLLEYSPDYAAERASGVVSDCARLGIELPAVNGPASNVRQVTQADLRGHDLTDGQRTGAPGHALGVLR